MRAPGVMTRRKLAQWAQEAASGRTWPIVGCALEPA